MDRETMFIFNLRFLIGFLVCAGFLAVIVFAAWTGMKAWIFMVRQQRSEARYEARRSGISEDGDLVAEQGVCDRCGRVYRKVYLLPTGERHCPICRHVIGGGLLTRPDADAVRRRDHA